jgi:hypothetical protein
MTTIWTGCAAPQPVRRHRVSRACDAPIKAPHIADEFEGRLAPGRRGSLGFAGKDLRAILDQLRPGNQRVQ